MGNTEGGQEKEKPSQFIEFNSEEFQCKIEKFYQDYIGKTTTYQPKQSYKEYKQLAPELISPINARCLNVQLQFSTYLVDNLSDKTIGFNLADQALTTSINNIDFFDKKTYVQPAQIMQEIRDNIQFWEKKYNLKSQTSLELS